MADITRNKPPRAAALIGVLAGFGLVVMAMLHLVAALQARAADPALIKLYDGGALSPAEVTAAAAALADSLRWQQDGRRAVARGLLLVSQSAKEDASALAAALAGDPGEPGAWLEFARRRLAAADRPGAVSALRLSILSGAFVPPLMITRLDVAFALIADLPADLRGLLARQIRLAWVLDPEPLLARMADPGAADLMIPALADMTPIEARQYRQRHRIGGEGR